MAARQELRKDELRVRLPSVEGQLVGREALLEQAWALLTGEMRRRVALVGPGGIGKTTLAALLAHQLLDQVPLDDVVWLTLTPGMTADDLLAACYNALHLPVGEPQALHRRCQQHDVLIVFDELENLIDSVFVTPDTLKPVLHTLEHARLMFTSR